jgi:antitoxin CptB
MGSDLSNRRKRLVYRSAYTGTKETDLLLGYFAEQNIATLTEEQLDEYEKLLEIEDPRLYKWITGMEKAPKEFQSNVLNLIKNFKLSDYLIDK